MYNEKQLIENILNGNRNQFSLIIERYQERVFRLTMGFLHKKEEAEDVTQEIFIKTYQSLHKYRGEAAFSTWLYRIAVTTSLTYIDRKKHRSFIINMGDKLHLLKHQSNLESGSDQIENNELNFAIKQAIDSLSPKQRTAFILQKYDEFSQKEIAEIMHTTEGAVEQHLQRAKLNLQKKLSHLVGKETHKSPNK